MKTTSFSGAAHFRGKLDSVLRGLVAFAAFALTGGTLFAELSPTVADTTGVAEVYEGYELSWSDEFNGSGYPDPANWNYELGTGLRNGEPQEYTRTNAVMSGGALRIIADKNEDGHYTSGSVVTKGCRHFQYGRYEFRARIPTSSGAWPCMWMMGTNYTWPWGGEIDILEYWGGSSTLLCNWYWANSGGGGSLKSEQKPLSYFTEQNANWANEFHVWRMDWTEQACDVWIDGVHINGRALNEMINESGADQGAQGISPYSTPQYILLNVAMGGSAGTIDDAKLPMVMEVDYVRCYKRTGRNEGMFVPGEYDTVPGTGAAYEPVTNAPAKVGGFHLAWNDEFDQGSRPNAANWNVYDDGNVAVADGLLTITSREASGGTFPATSMDTKGLHSFTNGYIEVRARVPIVKGVFSTMWTETVRPQDEYFYGYAEFMDVRYIAGSPLIAGWVQWTPDDNNGDWFDRQLDNLVDADPKWVAKFHVWKYAVDHEYVTVSVDGTQVYSRPLGWMNHNGRNTYGSDEFPHFLGMMLTTDAGATLDEAKLPAKLEVDYVRCYEYGEVEGEEEEGEEEEGEVEGEGEDGDGEGEGEGEEGVDRSLLFGNGGAYIRETIFEGEGEQYADITTVTSLAAARFTRDNSTALQGLWKANQYAVIAGYVGDSTGDFDYARNGGTDGGLPCEATEARGHTFIEIGASVTVSAPGKYTLCVGMPTGSDFDLKVLIEGTDVQYTMDTSDYDPTTRRAVKTFDIAAAGTYTLQVGQFRVDPGNYLELSYAPGAVAASDFSTERFVLLGKTTTATVDDDDGDDDIVDPDKIPSTGTPSEYAGYTLAWNEEFNTDGSPDTEKWVVADSDNAVCTGGALVMTAEDGTKEADYRYAGLQLVDGRFSFGHYEIRAKMPFGNGIHGAFQFDGSAEKGGYPTAGCFDLIDSEYAWNDAGEFSDTVALWTTWEEGHEKWSAKNITDFAGDDEEWADKYHVWTIDWDKDKIVLSLDGTVYNTVTTAEMTSSVGYSPAADPENMFSLLLALDKRVGVAGDALCEFPQTMEVDYIRYYVPESEDGDAFPKVDDVETTTGDEFVAAVKSGSTVTLPEGGDFAWNGNVLEKGGEPWATLPDYYTVGEGGKISFAVDAVKPVISAIAADATVKVTVSNAKKGLTYGLLSATTLEGLATAEPAWLETPATDDGPLDIPAGDKGAAGFFKVVVTDAP